MNTDRKKNPHQRHTTTRNSGAPGSLLSISSKRSSGARGSHRFSMLAGVNKRRSSKLPANFFIGSSESNPVYAEHVLDMLRGFKVKVPRISTPPEFEDEKLSIDNRSQTPLGQRLETISIVRKDTIESIEVQAKVSPMKTKLKKLLAYEIFDSHCFNFSFNLVMPAGSALLSLSIQPSNTRSFC